MDAQPINHQETSASTGGTYVAGIGDKYKMTLPQQVRQFLNVQPHDKLVFRIEDDTVTIVGKLPTVAETAGVVPPLNPPKSDQEIEAIVQEEIAQRYHEQFNT